MINKAVCKSLARKNGNDIIIWIWNNSIIKMTSGIDIEEFDSVKRLYFFEVKMQDYSIKIYISHIPI